MRFTTDMTSIDGTNQLICYIGKGFVVTHQSRDMVTLEELTINVENWLV